MKHPIALFAAVCALLALTATTALADPISGHTRWILSNQKDSTGSYPCLTIDTKVPDKLPDGSFPVVFYPCGATNGDDLWTGYDDNYEIKNGATGLCLYASNTAIGSDMQARRVEAADCTLSATKKWSFLVNSDSTVSFHNLGDDLWLDGNHNPGTSKFDEVYAHPKSKTFDTYQEFMQNLNPIEY